MNGNDSDIVGAITRPVRVLVADSHPLTRLGISGALGDGFAVCAEAEDADSAVAAAFREKPDICLLDVCMPGDGIKAAARIVAELPGTAVVMISATHDDETLFAILQAGAVGYLPKQNSFARLPEALRGVLRGEGAFPRGTTARLLGQLGRPGQIRRLGYGTLPGASLTSRETDVLELLLAGHGTAEIGAKLFLSQPTVRSHVAAVMRKFGVGNRAALRELFAGPSRLPDEHRR